MAEVTVKHLAKAFGWTVEKVLSSLNDAGIEKTSESEMVTDSEKLTLLSHLRSIGKSSELKTDNAEQLEFSVEILSSSVLCSILRYPRY